MRVFLSFSGGWRNYTLEWLCENGDDPIKCNDNSKFCYESRRKCDGIANCPNGEDEDFEMCNDFFSDLATVRCKKKNIYHLNISILATPCDGNEECQDGIDEAHCSMPDYYLIITLIGISIFCLELAVVSWTKTIRSLCPIDKRLTMTQEDFDSLHGTNELKSVMQQIQSYENASKINKDFVMMEINAHNGLRNETTLCIKVRSYSEF